MKYLSLGAAAIIAIAAAVQLQSNAQSTGGHRTVMTDSHGKPITDPKRDPHRAYYGNTYSNYHPGLSEGHHWWNEDGSEIYFQANWLPEGMILLKMIDGPHDSFVANGWWCSHNARARPTAGTAQSRAARIAGPYDDKSTADPAPKPLLLRSCATTIAGTPGEAIPDAMPGEHWVKLHLSSHLRDAREQYVLMPGHQ